MRGAGSALCRLALGAIALVVTLSGTFVGGGASRAAGVTTQVARFLIGYSVQHRPIWALRMGAADAGRKLLVVGSIAGDEPEGIAVVDALARLSPIGGVQIWLVPDMNPDGMRRGSRANVDGVDLNRNFPFAWRHFAAAGSRYYPGPRALSEPESRAVAELIIRLRPRIGIWLHEPYGLVDDSEGPRWAERVIASFTGLELARLSDYPGSAIGWEDHVVADSAFDVELPGGPLTSATLMSYANALRSVAEVLVDPRPRPAAKLVINGRSH